MEHNPVGWFDIPVTDMERAQKFYETVLGVKMKPAELEGYEMVWFPMIEDSVGSSGALMKGEGYTPSEKGTVVYFTCPDMDEAIARAEKLGGRVTLLKKDLGKWGVITWLTDSEGNAFALHKWKEE